MTRITQRDHEKQRDHKWPGLLNAITKTLWRTGISTRPTFSLARCSLSSSSLHLRSYAVRAISRPRDDSVSFVVRLTLRESKKWSVICNIRKKQIANNNVKTIPQLYTMRQFVNDLKNAGFTQCYIELPNAQGISRKEELNDTSN